MTALQHQILHALDSKEFINTMKHIHPSRAYVLLLFYLCLPTKPIIGQDGNNTVVERICNDGDIHTTQANYHFYKVNFDGFPNKEKRNVLKNKGIKLLTYQGNQTYLIAVPKQIDQAIFSNLGLEIIEAPSTQKYSSNIQDNTISEWARHSVDQIDIALTLNMSFTKDEWIDLQKKYSFEPLLQLNQAGTIRTVRIDIKEIAALAKHPNIKWIEEIEPPIEKLNYENRQVQASNVLQSTAIAGRALMGESVAIGIGDGGKLGNHIDMACRVVEEVESSFNTYGDHGDHVTGTAAGAGNLDPLAKGMAPKAELIIQKTTDIIYKAEAYIQEYDMVLTNNSYGVGADCALNGSYNYSSVNLDKQLKVNPHLIHVFAAGNSGESTCNNYPQGYNTLLSFYGSAKNVLSVGAIDKNMEIAALSSRGPAADGRLKPEICATGVDVKSTGRNYDYFEITGTSMATPSVVGTMALLYERYRQLHEGDNPLGALMKAIVCNTAFDLGNKGPDFIYGFGGINAKRAVECIENEQYVNLDIEHHETILIPLEIPAGVAEAKIMLYWHDQEGVVAPSLLSTSPMLVNDLDLKLISPNNNSYHPWILNINPAEVTKEAIRGIDRLNNIEQVTLENPLPGTYQIEVNGYNVPMGVQDFSITYDLVYQHVELTHPFGKETFVPETRELIQWDVAKTNIKPFVIEYSSNGGMKWELIADDIPASKRNFEWIVPATMTEDGKIRIRKKGENTTSSNEQAFVILSVPENLSVVSPCSNRIEINWDGVHYEAEYEIFMLDCSQMVSIGKTENTYFNLEGNMNPGEEYWFAVRTVTPNLRVGQRSLAVSTLISDVEDCHKTTTVEVLEEINTTEKDWTSVFNVYPNPFQETLAVDLKDKNFKIEDMDLIDLSGRSIMEKIISVRIRSKDILLNFGDHLPSGIYYLEITNKEDSYQIPIVKL